MKKKKMPAMSEYSVPCSLSINWDQTSCQLVLWGMWTIDEGAQTVPDVDDKSKIMHLIEKIGNFTLLATNLFRRTFLFCNMLTK